MDGAQRFHPLDRLIGDDSLFWLEAMVPFVDYRFKKLLVFFIKYRELMSILKSLNDRAYISDCGFDCHPGSTEEMISDMCNFLPGNYASSIKQMKQMMSMMEMMNMTDASGMNSGNMNMGGINIADLANQFGFGQNRPSEPTPPSHASDRASEAVPNFTPNHPADYTNRASAHETDRHHDNPRDSLYDSVLSILDDA